MKPLILGLFLTFYLPITLRSQFSLTPNGFYSQNDKQYIVLEVDGDKQELFKASELYFNKAYKKPKQVLNKVEYDLITISAKQPNVIRRNKMHTFDLSYSMTFEFRDNRIKVSITDITMTTFNQKYQTLALQGSNSLNGDELFIWSKKGKLKSQLAKLDLENFFNAFLSAFESSFENKDDW